MASCSRYARTTRRSADARIPVDNGTACFDVAVHQVRASPGGSHTPRPPAVQAAPHLIEREELSVLTAWAEAVVEAVSYAPEHTTDVLAYGHSGARWRAAMGLPEPSVRLAAAIESMEQAVGALDVADGELTTRYLPPPLRSRPMRIHSTAWCAECSWQCSRSAARDNLAFRRYCGRGAQAAYIPFETADAPGRR